MQATSEVNMARPERYTDDILKNAVMVCERELKRRGTMFREDGGVGDSPETAHQVNQTACRINARSAIQNVIDIHARCAARLRALLGALPQELSPEVDEALWEMAMSLRPK